MTWHLRPIAACLPLCLILCGCGNAPEAAAPAREDTPPAENVVPLAAAWAFIA